LHQRTMALLTRAEQGEDIRAALLAIRTAGANVELLARLLAAIHADRGGLVAAVERAAALDDDALAGRVRKLRGASPLDLLTRGAPEDLDVIAAAITLQYRLVNLSREEARARLRELRRIGEERMPEARRPSVAEGERREEDDDEGGEAAKAAEDLSKILDTPPTSEPVPPPVPVPSPRVLYGAASAEEAVLLDRKAVLRARRGDYGGVSRIGL
jgi:hypothetical protein